MKSIIKLKFVFLFFLFPSLSYGVCTTHDMQQMRTGGMNQHQINRICNRPTISNNSVRVLSIPATNICQTPQNWCVLSQSGPVNSSCWCATQSGPKSGVTVPPR